ncbi:MAG TPA: helix-turn-helix domain-containing protein [Desulfobulbus sp.]|nr:helix-turn-helix domain-containing protein [Desulfobulbus sp.]
MKTCYSCGAKITSIKNQPYPFTESGLNVVLYGVTQYECPVCKETYAAIPNVSKLHRVIGTHICRERKALLTPEEIKFLRKDLHLKAKDLAMIMGVTPATVSRWENGKKEIGEAHDRLLRSLYMMYATEQSKHVICEGVLSLFKGLPTKRKRIKQEKEIALNPQEWMNENFMSCEV